MGGVAHTDLRVALIEALRVQLGDRAEIAADIALAVIAGWAAREPEGEKGG
jgi:hypothetical protein